MVQELRPSVRAEQADGFLRGLEFPRHPLADTLTVRGGSGDMIEVLHQRLNALEPRHNLGLFSGIDHGSLRVKGFLSRPA